MPQKLFKKTPAGISRRDFLRYSAGAGVLLGAGPLLTACGGSNNDHSDSGGRKTGRRTFVFNFSHIDYSQHDLILVAGKQRLTLQPVTPAVRDRVRREHPILSSVPDEHLTHHLTDISMPTDAIQLCYVQRIARAGADGNWEMAMLFYHLPTSALQDAFERRNSGAQAADHSVPVKWARYGLTMENLAALADPVGEDMLKDSNEHATALVFGHPEVISIEPNSSAYIQNNIIATQTSTQALGGILAEQSTAWATNTPLINPDTGQPYTNSKGQTQAIAQWSPLTNQFAGLAINEAVGTVKKDRTLGVNITAIDPTNPGTATQGKIWTLHDGRPTVKRSGAQASSNGLPYTVANQSPDDGYSVTITNVDTSVSPPQITVSAQNWYVRYLGLYVRYLDANGNPIPVSSLSGVDSAFPLWSLGLNGDSDIFAKLISPEWVIFGIPVSATTEELTFPLVPQATSAVILAGGLGSGSNPYSQTIVPGEVMTVVFNLSLPPLFLLLDAAAGYITVIKELESNIDTVVEVLQLLITFLADLFASLAYDDPESFSEIAIKIGEMILSKGAGKLKALIAAAIAEGEAVEAVEDAVPVVGIILAAVTAAGVVLQVAETAQEVADSPKTYVNQITFAHTITVTIHPDPQDPAGFPAVTASGYYIVTYIFDTGTPHTQTVPLPATTVTAPIVVTLSGVPFGGQVTVSVGFYSPDGWLAGQGSIGPVANTSGACTTLGDALSCKTSDAVGDLAVEFAITENKVPLKIDTTYHHQELTVLDAQGNRIWQAAATPPPVGNPNGQCEEVNGQICAWTGITVSTVSAAVGYSWQSYNQAVGPCGSGESGQLYQFTNLSITQNPQAGYLFSGCGFTGPVRLIYDLLGKQGWNFYLDPNAHVLRQIRLGATPSFDGPNSNQAWGKLRFNSDALLLHPQGRVISINSEFNKIEVITLASQAVPDSQAPISQAYAGEGIREGLLNGPTLAALAPDGTILILEVGNNRIQAFDLSANPVPQFKAGAYFVPLVDSAGSGVTYLDMAVEYTGYIYVLSYIGQPPTFEYHLDIYTPDGSHLTRTAGFNAAKLAVNYWRDIFALNYQVLTLPNGNLPNVTEPSVSHWVPSV